MNLQFSIYFVQQYKMSQDKIDQQQEQKNAGRRSRKDQQGRDYVCGCGKSYLSYPALYTHIKTKHQGLRPQGTCRVSSVVNTKKIIGSNSHSANPPTNAYSINQDIFIVQRSTHHNLSQNPQISNSSNPNLQQKQPKQQQSSHIKNLKLILNPAVLDRIQHFTTIADYNLACHIRMLQLNQQMFTHANNRIVKQRVGQNIYEKYMQLVKLDINPENNNNNGSLQNIDLQQQQYDNSINNINDKNKKSSNKNDNQINDDDNDDEIAQLVEQRIQKLSNKSQLQYMMVVYLLGAGRFVNQKYMQYYMEFAKLFTECFFDHGEDIYQLCFKNNNSLSYNNNVSNQTNEIRQKQFKQREHVRQQRQVRQRDHPYKYYQYSYAPSSSKSKSYQSYQQSHQQHTHTHSHSQTNTNNTSQQIIINTKQCKYAPIICQFFAKIYINTPNTQTNTNTITNTYFGNPLIKNQHYRQIMQLLCIDFCGWLWRNKYTVVDVTINRKYQIRTNGNQGYGYTRNNNNNQRQKYRQRPASAINQQKQQQQITGSKKRQRIMQVPARLVTQHNTGATNNTTNKKIKKSLRQQQIQSKLSQIQISDDLQQSQNIQNLQGSQQQSIHENQSQIQKQHGNQNYNQNENENYPSHSLSHHHHDEDSYKLGHDIAIGSRERSGSIQQYINISSQHEQNQGIIQSQNINQNINYNDENRQARIIQNQNIITNTNLNQHQNQIRGIAQMVVANTSGERRGQSVNVNNLENEHHIDEQEIQKYINP